MNKTWKKMLALALTLCTVLGLMVPMAGAADASEYELPEIGPATYLGRPMTGGLDLNEFAARLTYEGKDYIFAPSQGEALYTLKLTDFLNRTDDSAENWIYDEHYTGISNPRGLVANPKNNMVYVVGDAAHVYAYDFVNKTGEEIALEDSDGARGLILDDDGNLYVSAEMNSHAVIYKVPYGSNTSEVLYTNEAYGTAMCIAYGDEHLYIQSASNTDGEYAKIFKVDLSGNCVAEYTMATTDGIYYLSYVNGILFGGHSGTITGGMVALNVTGETMEPVTLYAGETPVTGNIKGVVPNPKDGVSHMIITSPNSGLYRYDISGKAAGEPGTLEKVKDLSINLMIRDPYITFQDSNGKEATGLLTFTGESVPTMQPTTKGGATVSMSGFTTGTKSYAQTRTIAPGVSGEDAAVYVGGYLNPPVASYSPSLPLDQRLNYSEFNNGHSQTDSMIPYGDYLYGGCYSGAYLIRYDPDSGEVVDLITNLLADYGQLRIHALAAGDNKIFFSTVPKTGLGGVIGWYDLTNNTYTVKENVVPNQIVISLVYDKGLLYGASSIYGGSSATLKADEALLMVYDVDNGELLGNFSVRSEANINSDMSFGSVKPTYIAGIAKDPNGKLWGLVSRTLFSFSYDRTGKTLTVGKEWSVFEEGKSSNINYYPTGSTNHKFPRPMVFDEVGDGTYHMYVYPTYGGIRQMTISESTKKITAAQEIATGGRIYTLGTDGNLYYTSVYELYRVSLKPHSIVEDMITCAATGQNEITPAEARAAYNALDEGERELVSTYSLEALQALEGNECKVENGDAISYTTVAEATAAAGANTTISLLADYSGDIVVQGGATLDLAGYTVTGSVIVTDGIVKDSLGTGGIVLADSNDQISLVGATALPQIPLLDDDTYRFYSWDAKNLTSTKETDQVKFWFDLVFEDTEAYTLLSGNAQTHMDVYAWLYVDGTKQDASVVFDDAVKGWAAENHAGSDDYALYVGVTNIPKTVYDISVQPYIDIFGKRITLDKMDRDVAFIRAELKYGIYPN